jgi:hypothetical protein
MARIYISECHIPSGLPGFPSSTRGSDLDFLRFSSVFVTETPPTRGWPWLGPLESAKVMHGCPCVIFNQNYSNSKAGFCPGVVYGMVEVALPSSCFNLLQESKERVATAQEGPLPCQHREEGQETERLHTAS